MGEKFESKKEFLRFELIGFIVFLFAAIVMYINTRQIYSFSITFGSWLAFGMVDYYYSFIKKGEPK